MSFIFPTQSKLNSAFREANWHLVPVWLWFVLFVSMCVSLRFFLPWVDYDAAVTPQQALVQSPDLASKIDPHWKALTIDHGQVSEWPLGTKEQNPQGYRWASVKMVSSDLVCIALGFWILTIASKKRRG
jgi:hypothetical protein